MNNIKVLKLIAYIGVIIGIIIANLMFVPAMLNFSSTILLFSAIALVCASVYIVYIILSKLTKLFR